MDKRGTGMHAKSRLVGVLALCLAMAASALPASAQEAVTVQIHGVDDSDFPSLTVFVSALDANGQPIAGLADDDFEVLEDGVPGTLLDAQPVVNTDLGIAVVLAIDVSASMAGGPLDATKEAALAFINSLGEFDQVAVLAFADTVQVAQDFTSDKEAARTAVRGLAAGGRTALYDGAFQATQFAAW